MVHASVHVFIYGPTTTLWMLFTLKVWAVRLRIRSLKNYAEIQEDEILDGNVPLLYIVLCRLLQSLTSSRSLCTVSLLTSPLEIILTLKWTMADGSVVGGCMYK